MHIPVFKSAMCYKMSNTIVIFKQEIEMYSHMYFLFVKRLL